MKCKNTSHHHALFKKNEIKRCVFTLHFTDETSAIEVKVLNLKPYSPKKRIYICKFILLIKNVQ